MIGPPSHGTSAPTGEGQKLNAVSRDRTIRASKGSPPPHERQDWKSDSEHDRKSIECDRLHHSPRGLPPNQRSLFLAAQGSPRSTYSTKVDVPQSGYVNFGSLSNLS